MNSQVMVCRTKDEASKVISRIAPEHLETMKRIENERATPIMIVFISNNVGDMDVQKLNAIASVQDVVKFHNIRIDTQSARVWIRDTEVKMTAIEYRILKLLLSAPGRVFTKKQIYERCWKQKYVGAEPTINVHMCNLRSKIRQFDPKNDYIRTARGMGFAIEWKEERV